MPRTRADHEFAAQHPHPGDDPVVRLAHVNTIHADTDPDAMAVSATSGVYPEGRTGLTYGDLRALEAKLGQLAAEAPRAADLPDGSVVAHGMTVYLRRVIDEPTLPWQDMDGTSMYVNYADDSAVDEALEAGATVLRVGTGQ